MKSRYWKQVHRNLGLISEQDQQTLQNSTVAIGGLGGVGGGTFLDLCRMGVGHFAIADNGCYQDSDLNRQQGSCLEALDQNKTDVLEQVARAINPDVEIKKYPEGVTPDNVYQFLDGADFAVDAVDYFALEARQALHSLAKQRGLYVSLAAIFGFGATLVVFSPQGPSFQDLFGKVSGKKNLEHRLQFGRFLFPLTPSYLDVRSYLQSMRGERSIPSFCAPAALAGAMQSMDVVLHLLGMRELVCAPKVKWIDLHDQCLEIIDTRNPLTKVRQLAATLRTAGQVIRKL